MDRIEEWRKKKKLLHEQLEEIYKEILTECKLTEDVVKQDGQRGRIKVDMNYYLGECHYKFYPYKQNGELSNRGYMIYGCDYAEKEIKSYLLNKFRKAEAE